MAMRNMNMKTWSLITGIAAVVALGSGCGFFEGDEEEATVCEANTDCSDGEFCRRVERDGDGRHL